MRQTQRTYRKELSLFGLEVDWRQNRNERHLLLA